MTVAIIGRFVSCVLPLHLIANNAYREAAIKI